MKVAIYCRKSNDDGDGDTLQNQITEVRDYCAQQGYTIVGEYIEPEGMSGATKIRDRIAMPAMLSSNGYERVVTREYKRIARDFYIGLEVHNRLWDYGRIPVEPVRDKFIDGDINDLFTQFQLSLKYSFSQQDRKDTTINLYNGRTAFIKRGNVCLHGQRIFGYNTVEDRDPQYRVVSRQLEPITSEVYWVQQMFEWYDNGGSFRSVAKQLNEASVPTVRGGEWAPNTVAKILTNTTYAGTWRYGKDEKYQRQIIEHRETLEVTVPAVVDPDLFERVQARIGHNRENRTNRNSRNPSILRGYIFCVCGLACFVQNKNTKHKNKTYTYSYFKCAANYNGGDRSCDCLGVRQERTEAVVWQWVSDFLLAEDISVYFDDYLSENSNPHNDELRYYEGEITDTENRVATMARELVLVAGSEISKKVIRKQIADTEEYLAGLQQRYRDLRASSVVLTKEDIDTLAEFISEFREGVQDASEELKAKIYRLLSLRVDLRQDKHIRVTCELKTDNNFLPVETNNTCVSGPKVQIKSGWLKV